MLKKASLIELYFITCIILVTWFCGVWTGGREVAIAVESAYLTSIDEITVAQRDKARAEAQEEFMEYSDTLTIVVSEIIEMKCPEIVEQLNSSAKAFGSTEEVF